VSAYFAVRTPATKQPDGSIKGRQTFHPTIDQAVIDLDQHAGPRAQITKIVEQAVTTVEIEAARTRILEKAAKKA